MFPTSGRTIGPSGIPPPSEMKYYIIFMVSIEPSPTLLLRGAWLFPNRIQQCQENTFVFWGMNNIEA